MIKISSLIINLVRVFYLLERALTQHWELNGIMFGSKPYCHTLAKHYLPRTDGNGGVLKFVIHWPNIKQKNFKKNLVEWKKCYIFILENLNNTNLKRGQGY